VVFEERYHYSGGSLGLVYLWLAGGMLLSLSLAGIVSDRTFVEYVDSVSYYLVEWCPTLEQRKIARWEAEELDR
jgi:hypothetical protein